MGTVVQFGKQLIGTPDILLRTSRFDSEAVVGLDMGGIESTRRNCEILVESIARLHLMLDRLDSVRCMMRDPSNRQAIERQVVSARSQLSAHLLRLAGIFRTLDEADEQISKLYVSPKHISVDPKMT